MKEKILSIIVPVYNGEKHIERLLHSMLQGDFEGLEILLINDGSVDDSEKLCLKWKKAFPEVIKYVYKRNSGVCDTRNVGIANATGKYLGFADQDDFFEEYAIDFLIQRTRKSIADMLIFEPQVAYTNGKKKIIEMPIDNGLWCDDDLFEKIIMPMVFGQKNKKKQGFNLGLWNCLFRKQLLDVYELRLDTYLRMGEDITFITQAICVSNIVETIKKPLYNWFVNEKSVSHTYVKASQLSIIKSKYIIQKKEEALSKFPKEKWQNYIHPSYAHILVSFVRNWTHPLCDENFFNIIKRVNEIYNDRDIYEHSKKVKVRFSNGKEKVENWFVKHRLTLCLIIYCYILHAYIRLREKRSKKN